MSVGRERGSALGLGSRFVVNGKKEQSKNVDLMSVYMHMRSDVGARDPRPCRSWTSSMLTYRGYAAAASPHPPPQSRQSRPGEICLHITVSLSSLLTLYTFCSVSRLFPSPCTKPQPTMSALPSTLASEKDLEAPTGHPALHPRASREDTSMSPVRERYYQRFPPDRDTDPHTPLEFGACGGPEPRDGKSEGGVLDRVRNVLHLRRR